MPINIPEAVEHTQSNWRFCHQCFSLFFNGDSSGRKGICNGAPQSGGGHKAAGFDFYLLADTENSI